MTDNPEYPYLASYLDITEARYELVESVIKPAAVVRSRFAMYAEGLVAGNARAIMMGGEEDSEIILDFGREIVGKLCILLSSPAKGELKLFYGENFQEAMRTAEYTACWYRLPKDIIRVSNGQLKIENQGRRAFRFVRLLYSGHEGMHLQSVTAVFRHYPVAPRGHFSSSSGHLNDIWRISTYTTKLCMQQFYEDGVKRDGLLWIADYRMQFLCAWHAFGDLELARKSLYMMACTQRADGAIPACAGKGGGHQHPSQIDYMPGVPHGSVDEWIILNYCTDFISCLYEYWLLTGDRTVAIDLWPVAQRALRFLHRTARLDRPELFEKGAAIADSAKPEDVSIITDAKPGYQGWWPSHGTFLMQLFWAVADAIRLDLPWSATEDAIDLQKYLITLRREIMDRYYFKNAGIFGDYSAGHPEHGAVSWHVNAFGILSRLVTGGEAASIMERIGHRRDATSPAVGLMKGRVVEALFQAGLGATAVAQMLAYWGPMLENGGTTCWEGGDSGNRNHIENSSAAPSLCHGWSAGPAFLLPRYVLGVAAVEPGYKKIIVNPNLGDLEWAEGTIPSSGGEIFVHFEKSPIFHGLLMLPDGVSGQFHYPVNGKIVSMDLHSGMNLVPKATN